MSACRDVAEEPPRPVSPKLCPNVNNGEGGSGSAEATAGRAGQSGGDVRDGVQEEQAHEEDEDFEILSAPPRHNFDTAETKHLPVQQ